MDAERAARRGIYRRLVAARRVKTAWVDVSRWLDDPQKKIGELVDAADFIRAMWSVRNFTDHPSAPDFDPPRPGFRVVALSRRPDLLRQFRRMSADQRAELAADHLAGAAMLNEQNAILRNALGRRSKTRRLFIKIGRYLWSSGVELMLVAFGLVALAIALWRQMVASP
jgi:hypothetical protein